MINAAHNIKVLCFDVFGTLVDWRAGVACEAEAVLKPRGFAVVPPDNLSHRPHTPSGRRIIPV